MKLIASGYASAKTISLTNIPQDGNTIYIIANLESDRSSTDSQCSVYLNSNTSAAYNIRLFRLYGDDNQSQSNYTGYDGYSWTAPGANASRKPGFITIKITNYSNTNIEKTIAVESLARVASTDGLNTTAGVRTDITAAITSVQIYDAQGSALSGNYWVYTMGA